MKQTFAIVLEQGPESWGAHAPDLPNVYAVGTNQEEARQMLVLGIEEHFRALAAQGLPLPEPTSRLGRVTIDLEEVWPNKPALKLEIVERG